MTDDIVDFDDLDEFDYSDLGDINAADLDIENLERELGLVDDDATKESTTPAKSSEDASKAEPQTTTADKKELKDRLTSSSSTSSTTAAVTSTATAPAATPSLPQNRSATATASPSTKPSSSQEPSARSQQPHKPMGASGLGSSSPRKTGGGGPRSNNAFQGAGGIMYSMPPTNMVHMGQFPFAQGMMGMNMMMMPPPPPPSFPTPFPQMAFPGAQKIHINPKFAASRPDIFGANNNNGNPMAHQQQQQQHRRAQPGMQSIPQSSQEIGDNNALKRQRELIMEQQRKRRERREAEVKAEVRNGGVVSNGSHFQHQARTNAPTSTVANNRDDQLHPGAPEKREFTIKGLGTSKGISIKGAAAAASATSTMPSPPPLQQYQPPHRRRVADASSPPQFDSLSPARTTHSPAGNPNVLSRITQRGAKRSSPPPSDARRYEPPTKKSAIPIQTAGKSSKITIANVSTNVSEDDIMGLAKSIPGRIETVKIDKSAKKAVVAFDSPESAIIFRRQYNRSHLDGEVIVVTFCT